MSNENLNNIIETGVENTSEEVLETVSCGSNAGAILLGITAVVGVVTMGVGLYKFVSKKIRDKKELQSEALEETDFREEDSNEE